MSTRIFDKYDIERRLAIGGMGEVFLAMQRGVRGFERPAILKSLLPDLASDGVFVEQFLDEARVAATLNHPNVVSIYEVGAWEGSYFIAMEYIQGRNLSQLSRQAASASIPPQPEVMARIVHDAALGLHHAHTAVDAQGQPLGIVHRDISPQNIMVRDDGVTKVVDFGIARIANQSTRTKTGVIKGKIPYMAPEQLDGRPVSAATDVFALGIVLWEMLTFRRLFKANTEHELVQQVLKASIPRPSLHNTDVSSALDAIVERMVHRDAGQRYASCAAVATDLEGWLATRGAEVETPAAYVARLPPETSASTTRTASKPSNFVISLRSGDPEMPSASTRNERQPISKESGSKRVVSKTKTRTSNRRIGALAGALAVASFMASLGLLATLGQPEPPGPPPVPVQHPAQPLALPSPVLPLPAPPSPALPSPGAPTRATPEPQAEPVVAPKEAPKPPTVAAIGKTARAAPARAPVALAGPGFLTLDTTPWTKVSLEGEPLGSTPLFRRKLPVGRHRLLLINEGAGVRTEREVDIRAGETTKLSVTLK